MLIDGSLAKLIAREALSEPYRQIGAITTRRLETFLKDRGIGLHWESIHYLWSVGILHPVAVLAPALNLTPNLELSSRFPESTVEGKERFYVDLGVELTDDIVSPLPTSRICPDSV